MKKGVLLFLLSACLVFPGCGDDDEENPLNFVLFAPLSQIVPGDNPPCTEYEVNEEVVIKGFRMQFPRGVLTWDPGEKKRELNIFLFTAKINHPSVSGGAYTESMDTEYLNFLFQSNGGKLGAAEEVPTRPSCTIQFGKITLPLEFNTPSFSTSVLFTIIGTSADPDGSNPRTEKIEFQGTVNWSI